MMQVMASTYRINENPTCGSSIAASRSLSLPARHLSGTLPHLASLALQTANTLLAPLPPHLGLGLLPRIGLVRHFSVVIKSC